MSDFLKGSFVIKSCVCVLWLVCLMGEVCKVSYTTNFNSVARAHLQVAGLQVQLLHRLVRVHIARGANGHNVGVRSKQLKRHWVVVLALLVLVEHQLGTQCSRQVILQHALQTTHALLTLTSCFDLSFSFVIGF